MARAWKLHATLALFVVLATIYSVITPAFETPDEIWHFAFIQHVATGQGLPVSEPNTQALWQQQGVQAPGYYLAAAALTAWIDQSDFPAIYARHNPHRSIGRPQDTSNKNWLIHHSDEAWPWRGSLLALHIARFFSILLGAVTLWATYRTLLPILGEAQAPLGTALVAFTPQFIFISAAASNDNAVNALAALVLWRLVTLILDEPREQGAQRRAFTILGVLLGLALLSKLSTLALLGLAGVVVLWMAWRAQDWRVVFDAALWIGLPALAIGGWWYARNWWLYADPLAWNIWQANILLRVQPAGWRRILAELGGLERSFWGLFGWLNVAYPEPIYLFFRSLEWLILLGWLPAIVGWIRAGRSVDRRWLAAGLLLLWLLLLTISWLRFMRIAPAAQGRYFFPAASTLALIAVIGIRGWRIWTLGGLIVGALFVVSALTPFLVIRPAYAPPPARAELVSKLTPVAAEVGGLFVIEGVGIETSELAPGDVAEVHVAWHSVAPTDKDYSVFVHLVDEQGLIAAQLDTMPGGGYYPTSEWSPGELRVETYRVYIPATVYTPSRARWVVGLYDAATDERLPIRLETARDDSEFSVWENGLRFGEKRLAAAPGSVPNPIAAHFADNITLAGYALSSRRLRPGEPLTVTLFWQARGPVSTEYTLFVHLLDADYQTHGGDDDTPQPGTHQWPVGEVITDVHEFVVSPDAPPGLVQLEVGLYTRPDFDRLALLDAAGAEGADRILLGPLRVEP